MKLLIIINNNDDNEDFSGFLRLSLLLFELPTVPGLLVQLFLNQYNLSWWTEINGE